MIPFAGGSNQTRSKNEGSSLLVNFYKETIIGGKYPFVLMPTAGTETWSDLGVLGTCRGLHTTASGVPYGVYGGNIVKLNSDKTGTVVYSFPLASSGFVSMADNGYFLLLADGTNLSALNLETNVLQEVGPSDSSNPTFVKYMNQRFMMINGDTTRSEDVGEIPNNNKIYFSEVGPTGCLTWFNLSFFSSESSADANISMEISANAMWIWGSSSFEVYQTTANPDAPMRRIGGASGEIGCKAPHSVSTIGGQVFWLGSSKAGTNQIFMSQGYNPVVISTHAISYQLSLLGDTSDAVSFCYQKENHTFYVLTFIGGNKTFVYDVTEGEWFNQTTREPLVNQQNRWAVIFAVNAYATTLCGKSSSEGEDSLVLELSLDKYDDWDGRPIVRTAQGVHLWDDLRPVYYRELRVDCDVRATQNGLGSDPVLMMSFSDDGGNTFTSERTVKLGKIGAYETQVSWLFLGSSRNRVFRFTYSDPAFLSIGGVRAITDQSDAY